MIDDIQMKAVSQEDARAMMLNIMDDIDSFCHHNSITYYLAFGTLIGAIRHKGFIPWDDDLDIMMPRPDYERFIREYKATGKFSIHSPYEQHPLFYYSKVYDPRTIKIESGVSYSSISPLGVDIDVFPLDGYPAEMSYRKIQKRKKLLDFIYLLRYYAIDNISFNKSKKHPLGGCVLGVITHLIGNRNLMKKYCRIASKYNYEYSDLVAEYGLKLNVFNREDLVSVLRTPFEDRLYDIPVGYDSVLRSSYGDYMVLPPIEEQTTHHINRVFWRE